MGRAIFISYRRDDAEGEAGRLFDDLVRAFGNQSVFMDVTDIKPGLDFRKVIDDNVATCGVLLSVIGPGWTAIAGNSGERRLDDPNDFVRLEIASALARDIAVIPVLVHDAKMPRPDQLPDNLKDLAFRNSVEITHARWNSDVRLLIDALGKYVAESSQPSAEPVHATVAVQLPPANPPAHEPPAAHSSRTPMIVGIAVAVVLAAASVAFFALHRPAHASERGPRTADTPASASLTPAAVPAEAPAAPVESPLAGTWTYSKQTGRNGLTRLAISGTGTQISVHAWGKCQPADCDWGTQPATLDGQNAQITWTFPLKAGSKEEGRVVTVTLKPDNDRLSVDVLNTYPNHPNVRRQFEFDRSR